MENSDKLIPKYNKPGPRYTSYPAVPIRNPLNRSRHRTITKSQEGEIDFINLIR